MRTAEATRTSKETDINIKLNLDGGDVKINTGIGFFDHMLEAFAVHGGFGLQVNVKGDLHVDCHHTIEDTGIVLGKAFAKALGNKSAIERFGSFYIPMDEALSFAAVDISGRPFLIFNAVFPQERTGNYDCCMTEEFMRAFAFNAGITLHIKNEYGCNSHHIIESIFKAVAHAMKAACKPNNKEVLSTKGMLD